MPMIQSDFYTICTGIIAVLILLLCVAGIILKKHRGSNDTTRQLARIIAAVFLFCSIICTTFIMLSVWIYTPNINIHRTYENPAVDRNALAKAEGFNYTDVIGALPGNTNIFPHTISRIRPISSRS